MLAFHAIGNGEPVVSARIIVGAGRVLHSARRLDAGPGQTPELERDVPAHREADDR